MSDRAAKRERVEQMLGELAELSLMLARDLAAEARACEDPEQKAALVEAFQKTALTTRLTLALDAKLDRQAARDARDAARDAEAQAADAQLRESRIMKAAQAAHHHLTQPSPEENQKRRVKAVLNRLIWNEAESDEEEYDVLLEDLDARLYEAEDAPGFADMPIEVLAEKLARDMRLSGELVVTTAEAFAPPLQSGRGGPLAERSEERVVEGANTSQPPLADTG